MEIWCNIKRSCMTSDLALQCKWLRIPRHHCKGKLPFRFDFWTNTLCHHHSRSSAKWPMASIAVPSTQWQNRRLLSLRYLWARNSPTSLSQVIHVTEFPTKQTPDSAYPVELRSLCLEPTRTVVITCTLLASRVGKRRSYGPEMHAMFDSPQDSNFVRQLYLLRLSTKQLLRTFINNAWCTQSCFRHAPSVQCKVLMIAVIAVTNTFTSDFEYKVDR